jgi:hypothetical protein
MPNLRRIAPLATVVATLAFAPAALGAVASPAPTKSPARGHRFEIRERRGFKVATGHRVTPVVHPPSRHNKAHGTTSGGSSVGSSSGTTAPSTPSAGNGGSGKGSSGTSTPATPGKPTTPVTTPSAPVTTPTTTPEAPSTTTPPIIAPPVTTPPITTPTTPITTPTTVTAANSPGALFASSAVRAFQVDHSAPGAISEVPDPLGSGSNVIQMTVHNSDVYPITPTENPRAELISQPLVSSGQEVWLHTKFLVPTDYPTVPAGGWVSLLSFYGAPFAGPSPFHLEIDGDQLTWQRNQTYGFDIPYRSTLVKGQWTDVLVHEKFASNGFLELWINGQPIEFFGAGSLNPSHHAATTKLEMATMDSTNDGAPNAAKIMQYREAGMFETGTIYFNGLQVGASRASVGA